MTVIFVYGLYSYRERRHSQKSLDDLRQDLKRSTTEIVELELGNEQVSVSFPCNAFAKQRLELITEVRGLSLSSKLTPEVEKHLAKEIMTILRLFCKNENVKYHLRKVMVHCFDEDSGVKYIV
jgi:hypothetical protein